MQRILGILNDDEKVLMSVIAQESDCLIELELSFGKIYLSQDEKEQLVDKHKKKSEKIKKLRQEWWEDMCKKYGWDQRQLTSWILKYDTNEVIGIL